MTLLDRYVNEPAPSVLLVGSSFTARLEEEYFDTPDLKVLGLSGGSPITALEIALARDNLPKTILVGSSQMRTCNNVGERALRPLSLSYGGALGIWQRSYSTSSRLRRE